MARPPALHQDGVVRGRTNGYKKAIVSLADGQTIDFYDNI